MIEVTQDKLISAYKNKNYPYYKQGDFNVNLFGIRCVDSFDNKFSDILGISYSENGVLKILTIPGTTRPGTLLHDIPGGVACIVPGYYPKIWEFRDDYTGWLKYPYFYQIGKFRIWRDEKKDEIIDHTNEQDIANVGLNCHRMSWDGIEGQTGVFNWSEGCQGSEEPEFKKLLPIIRESVKKYGNIFSYALFELKDFV